MAIPVEANLNEDSLFRIFRIIDTNGSGFVSVGALRYLLTLVQNGLSDEDADGLLAQYDNDGERQLSFECFKHVMLDRVSESCDGQERFAGQRVGAAMASELDVEMLRLETTVATLGAKFAGLDGMLSDTTLQRGCLPIDVKEQAVRNAAERGDAAAIERMLARGACVDAVVPGEWKTPLHIAAGAGHVEAVKVLLDAGASCDAAVRSVLSDGRNALGTVLHHAVYGGSSEVVNLLLADPSSLLMSAEDKRSLLILAVQADAAAIFKIFADAFPEARPGDERFLRPLLVSATKKINLQLVGELVACAMAEGKGFSSDFHMDAIAQAVGQCSAEILQTLFRLRYRVSFSAEAFRRLVLLACGGHEIKEGDRLYVIERRKECGPTDFARGALLTLDSLDLEDGELSSLRVTYSWKDTWGTNTREPTIYPIRGSCSTLFEVGGIINSQDAMFVRYDDDISAERASLVQLLFAEVAPVEQVLSLRQCSIDSKRAIMALDLSGTEQFRLTTEAGDLTLQTLRSEIEQVCRCWGHAPRLRIFETDRELILSDEVVSDLAKVVVKIERGIPLSSICNAEETRSAVEKGEWSKLYAKLFPAPEQPTE